MDTPLQALDPDFAYRERYRKGSTKFTVRSKYCKLLQNEHLVLSYRKKLRNSKSSCRGLDLHKFPFYTETTEEKEMRNKQKHINVTVANQFTVHRNATKRNFS